MYAVSFFLVRFLFLFAPYCGTGKSDVRTSSLCLYAALWLVVSWHAVPAWSFWNVAICII